MTSASDEPEQHFPRGNSLTQSALLGWSSDFPADNNRAQNFFDRYADHTQDADDEDYLPLPVGGVRPNRIVSDERRRQMREEAIASISDGNTTSSPHVSRATTATSQTIAVALICLCFQLR